MWRSICGTVLKAFAMVSVSLITIPAKALDLSVAPPDGKEFAAAIEQLQDQPKLLMKQTAKEVFPLFIFVPGVMGSRLTKTSPNEQPKTIWGKFNGIFAAADKDLAYSETDVVKADVMDEYYVARDSSVDVYGNAIDTMKVLDLSQGGNNVRKFAYDWRQSNRKSAADFASWLCANKEEFKTRSLVIVAHSMGGLVVKSWLKDLYQASSCGGSETFSAWAKIRRVIFLGTPHYGAPKAVTAFADQYSIMVDRDDSTMSAILGGIDALTVSKSVNAFGATFPSAYELLPIVNTNDCFKNASWPFPVSVKSARGQVTNQIDLFRKDTWELFNWPKILHSSIDRATFMNNKLPALLDAARTFSCDLIKFRPEQIVDVVRVVGLHRKTICAVTINQPQPRTSAAVVDPQFCDDGDGTVPRWVASEDNYMQADKTVRSGQAHMRLVGSDEFLDYLKDYGTQLHRELQEKYAERGGSDQELVNLYATVRATVSPRGDDPNSVTSRVARGVVNTLGVEPDQIYVAAKATENATTRADTYRVFADVAAQSDPKRAWALNNAANIKLRQNKFPQALILGRRALEAGIETDSIDAIKYKAGSTAATAAEQLKDPTALMLRGISVGRIDARSIDGRS